MSENNPHIPIIPLRGGAVFPGLITTITIGRKRSLKAAQAAGEHNRHVIIMVQYDVDVERPLADDLAPIGVLGLVRDLTRSSSGGVQMMVELVRRVRLNEITQTNPYLSGTYEELTEALDGKAPELAAKAIAYVEEYAAILGDVNRQVINNLRTKETAGELSDYIASIMNLSLPQQIELLVNPNGYERLEQTIGFLNRELQIAELRAEIQQEARDGADKAQREFLLREQMRAIRRELGEDDTSSSGEVVTKIKNAGMPEEVEARALQELRRLERMGDHAAESSVLRTYLEWLVELPWSKLTEDNLDVDHTRQVLDEDHYGLEDVKDRIVEYVAVRKLAGSAMRGPIINLNGPPGVGKTSIATSVARALGRKVVRISLGGVRDEAEIRGHRRTYIGAIPGRLLRALRDVQTRNPVIVLDEIDKVGADWRGDPSSALLEVLDPEQNHSFTDHYLEVPFDLSQVIFITTSNTTRTIPPALFDRMETIAMPGYIEEEKLSIAEQFLVGRQLAAHAIGDYDVTIERDALLHVIRHHTYEAGVRQLERHIGTLVRKIAVRIARDETGPFTLTVADVQDHLGPDKYTWGAAEEKSEIGLVTGLAVVGYSGDTLAIEVSLTEGGGRIRLTGSLGNVMRESAQAALTYMRSRARMLGVEPSVFDKTDIHIHVPAGATPKDGPSAGIALTTAIVSAFTRRPVRKEIGMTGEVTLRGKVLQIGGFKAKAIAAHRAGLKQVVFPHENLKDLPDVPSSVKEDLVFTSVQHMDEVLELALLAAEEAPWGSDWPEVADTAKSNRGEDGESVPLVRAAGDERSVPRHP